MLLRFRTVQFEKVATSEEGDADIERLLPLWLFLGTSRDGLCDSSGVCSPELRGSREIGRKGWGWPILTRLRGRVASDLERMSRGKLRRRLGPEWVAVSGTAKLGEPTIECLACALLAEAEEDSLSSHSTVSVPPSRMAGSTAGLPNSVRTKTGEGLSSAVRWSKAASLGGHSRGVKWPMTFACLPSGVRMAKGKVPKGCWLGLAMVKRPAECRSRSISTERSKGENVKTVGLCYAQEGGTEVRM